MSQTHEIHRSPTFLSGLLRTGLLVTGFALFGACASADRGIEHPTDDVGEEDVILRTFEEPREAQEETEAERKEQAPPAEEEPGERPQILEDKEETEDSLLATVEGEERDAGALEVETPEEPDASTVREDPILDVLKEDLDPEEEEGEEKEEAEKEEEEDDEEGGGGVEM